MEYLHPMRSPGRDRSVSESIAMRAGAGSVMESGNNRSNARASEENRSPATVPRAFEGMLKTTTETGDIGMFSIRPSRLPQVTNTPRRTGPYYNKESSHKPRQSFQPFGFPTVDDRRRLPSYARDVTSEIVSMYETASQKSASRAFENPDYRSYSLTQTSYSAYTLSNHRSCTSLRSQQDSNGYLQRPRSPFAYPARLKRPGFRPSSPALTDGGAVDYTRRAEINRAIYGGHSTSSPSSLYAQKRKPPLSLRQDANRSTPSLLSQSSPPRRSPSPGMRRSDGNIAQDWSRKNGLASGNTSPARSNLSFASTINLYASASGTSSTTTPGKLAQSSPLYYDYTEDFEIDDCNQTANALGSPPLFILDKTIPEERPTKAEPSISAEPLNYRLTNSVNSLASPSPRLGTPTPLESTRKSNGSQLNENQFEPYQPPPRKRYTSVQTDNAFIGKTAIRLSGLGYGAQELNTHVEEAFGLLCAESFEVSVPRTALETVTSGDQNGHVADVHADLTAESQFTAVFPKRLDAHPPRLSSLPSARRPQRHEGSAALDGERSVNILSHILPTPDHLPGDFTFPTDPARSAEFELSRGPASIQAPSSGQNQLYSSSGYKPIDMGVSGLADLIKTLEESNRGTKSEVEAPVSTASRRPPTSVPSSLQGALLHNKNNTNYAQMPHVSSLNRSNANNFHASTRVPHSKRTQPYEEFQKGEASTLGAYVGFKSPNFNNPVTMRNLPRSESPILAPKPISPARQLKLKNSVPQLMKALPPLPPEPRVRPKSPVSTFDSVDNEMPCCFSPLLPELNAGSLRQEIRHESDNATSHLELQVIAKEEESNAPVNVDEQAGSTTPTLPHLPARLKLKLKSCASTRPLSPPSPEPWRNGCAYSPSILGPGSASAGAFQGGTSVNTKPPKFKLKITRASSSSFGTVRVNRDSGDSNPVAGFHLGNHKDLFTSTTGIDQILRHVGRHLHSKKASEVSNTSSDPSGHSIPPIVSLLSPDAHVTHSDTSLATEPEVHGTPSTVLISSQDARSFFSGGSSHVQGHSSVRDRISHLEARITVPYSNRKGSKSYDDLTWRDRNRPEAAAPAAQGSASNLRGRSKSTDSKPSRSLTNIIHRHQLRERVKGWFKEARLAFKSRMKPRTTTRSAQDADAREQGI